MLVNRDPFAREELHRTCVISENSCSWCGGKRKGGKLFKYLIQQDDGRMGWIKGIFCCVSCMRSYHS